MENWGLVTYREAQLLIDEQNSSARTKQRVAIVISHELAHQWFGNLVTMVGNLCRFGRREARQQLSTSLSVRNAGMVDSPVAK